MGEIAVTINDYSYKATYQDEAVDGAISLGEAIAAIKAIEDKVNRTITNETIFSLHEGNKTFSGNFKKLRSYAAQLMAPKPSEAPQKNIDNLTSPDGPPLTPDVVSQLSGDTKAEKFLRVVAKAKDLLELDRELQKAFPNSGEIPGLTRIRERTKEERQEKKPRPDNVARDYIDRALDGEFTSVSIPDTRQKLIQEALQGVERALARSTTPPKELSKDFNNLKRLIAMANNQLINKDSANKKTGMVIRGADEKPDEMDILREVDAFANYKNSKMGKPKMTRTQALLYIVAYKNIVACYQAAMVDKES